MVREEISNNVRSWKYFHSSEKKWPPKAVAVTEYPSTIVFLKRHPLKTAAYLFIRKLVDGYSVIYLIVLNRNNINIEELLILEFFMKQWFYSLDIWKRTRRFAHRWLSITSCLARPRDRRIILKDIIIRLYTANLLWPIFSSFSGSSDFDICLQWSLLLASKMFFNVAIEQI